MHSILSCNRQNRIFVIVWTILCSRQILAFNNVQAMTIKLSPSLINYVTKSCPMTNENRELASSDEETRKRVAREGGKAQHDERGLEAADEETRKRVAREGGKA